MKSFCDMTTEEQFALYANDNITGVSVITGEVLFRNTKHKDKDGDYQEINGIPHVFENGQWVRLGRYEKESPKFNGLLDRDGATMEGK